METNLSAGSSPEGCLQARSAPAAVVEAGTSTPAAVVEAGTSTTVAIGRFASARGMTVSGGWGKPVPVRWRRA